MIARTWDCAGLIARDDDSCEDSCGELMVDIDSCDGGVGGDNEDDNAEGGGCDICVCDCDGVAGDGAGDLRAIACAFGGDGDGVVISCDTRVRGLVSLPPAMPPLKRTQERGGVVLVRRDSQGAATKGTMTDITLSRRLSL